MTHLIINASRFTMIIMFAIYTYDCFAALKNSISEKRQKRLYHKQNTLMYLILLNAYICLLLATGDVRYIGLFLLEVIFFVCTLFIYQKIYKNASKSIVNNMCMLLTISFIILARLDMDKAVKQFLIACVAMLVSCFIPVLIHKCKIWDKLTWLYALVGIAGLAVVAGAGSTVYGAKLNISIGGFTIQPSEFIKIVFVFFVACMLNKSIEFSHVVKTTVIAAIYVLILVASRDLGGALIFLLTYLVMLFVATRNPGYMFLGLGCGALASVIAYHFFSHVQTRVLAWKDPLSVADDEGYQICQSLFAIGTGGWFGSGLFQGMPKKIPVVAQDFVFSAISEEMGGVFALCIIFVCISCFLMFFNISMQMKEQFYKLIALGLGTVYGTQVFLTLGGVTKFIPSTGVTLPLVSYGGSSLFSTLMMFAIIQGLYAIRLDEGEYTQNGKKKSKPE